MDSISTFKEKITTYLNQISIEERQNYNITSKILAEIDIIINNNKSFIDLHFDIIINIIFDKSTTLSEKIFIDVYCDLCSNIMKRIISIKDGNNLSVIFYRKLITKCQDIFEKDEEMRMEGCIIFISQLINKKLIPETILNLIVTDLFKEYKEKNINNLIILLNNISNKKSLNSDNLLKLKESLNINFSSIRIILLLEEIYKEYSN